MTRHKQFNTFRKIAIAEGISYLLFAVTMPLKYGLDITTPNKVVGMAHGVVFIVYIVFCLWMAVLLKWNLKTIIVGLVASLLPFGTFYADAKFFKPELSRIDEKKIFTPYCKYI